MQKPDDRTIKGIERGVKLGMAERQPRQCTDISVLGQCLLPDLLQDFLGDCQELFRW